MKFHWEVWRLGCLACYFRPAATHSCGSAERGFHGTSLFPLWAWRRLNLCFRGNALVACLYTTTGCQHGVYILLNRKDHQDVAFTQILWTLKRNLWSDILSKVEWQTSLYCYHSLWEEKNKYREKGYERIRVPIKGTGMGTTLKEILCYWEEKKNTTTEYAWM